MFYNKFISCLYIFRAHVLIKRRSKLHYTASGIITPIGDEHMCSKHVEAWNKLIVKQKFCASSWLVTDINVIDVPKPILKLGLGRNFGRDWQSKKGIHEFMLFICPKKKYYSNVMWNFKFYCVKMKESEDMFKGGYPDITVGKMTRLRAEYSTNPDTISCRGKIFF